jgi:hypothetical protein
MDHWARIEAAVAGRVVDRVPVALWKHFPHDDQDAGKLAARTLEWQRAWDFDLVKFMPSGTYGVEDWGARTVFDGAANGARVVAEPGVKRAEDWPRLARLDPARGVLGAQNAALALAAKELKGSVPILQTVFSPLTTARKLRGEALVEEESAGARGRPACDHRRDDRFLARGAEGRRARIVLCNAIGHDGCIDCCRISEVWCCFRSHGTKSNRG